jgi:hypothetical protein
MSPFSGQNSNRSKKAALCLSGDHGQNQRCNIKKNKAVPGTGRGDP